MVDYCRGVAIVTNNQNDQFHPKTGQFRHFFKVKYVGISLIPLGSIRLMTVIEETMAR